MDKVLISNSQGESGIVNVIRYFTNNGVEYLIYSLNEVDEGGYTRLYVTKINGVDGVYNADTLNDNEWNEIKNIVKLIVKANKEGLPVPVQDLNPKKINNIILKDKKVFKLNAPLVADLGNNKPTFGEVEEKPVEMQKNIFEVPSTPTFETPVQPIFEQNISTFEQSMPTFEMPTQQTFEQSVPSFEKPTQPTFEQSVPSFEMSTQPTFEQSVPPFEMPTQPTFEQSVPSFKMSTQPTFEQSVPSFEMSTQPTFEQSVPSFEMPPQPTFEQSMPTFEMPTQPTFEQSVPSFEMPVQPNINSNLNAMTDYQRLNNEELTKNENMKEQITKLNAELEKYKNIISNVKNMIEE